MRPISRPTAGLLLVPRQRAQPPRPSARSRSWPRPSVRLLRLSTSPLRRRTRTASSPRTKRSRGTWRCAPSPLTRALPPAARPPTAAAVLCRLSWTSAPASPRQRHPLMSPTSSEAPGLLACRVRLLHTNPFGSHVGLAYLHRFRFTKSIIFIPQLAYII